MNNRIIILFTLLLCSSVNIANNHHTIDSLKHEISIAKSDSSKILLLNELAIHLMDYNRNTASAHLNQALIIARKIDNPHLKTVTLLNLGSNYCNKGDFLKSLEYYDLAISILDEHPDKSLLADIYLKKSIVYISINSLNKANEFANKALVLNKQINNLKKIEEIYSLIAEILFNLGSRRKSLDYSKLAYKLAKENREEKALAVSINNLAVGFFQANYLDSASYYLHTAIGLNRKFDNKSWLAINYQNMAELKLQINEIDSAEFYISKAINLYNETDYKQNRLASLEINAKVALAKADTAYAIKEYELIIESVNRYENLSSKVTSYKALYEIFKSSGNLNRAIEYLELYKIYDDSLKKETNTSLLALMEMQMKYKKKQSLLELEKNEAILISEKKNQILYVLIIAIVLLTVLSISVFRLKKIKSKAILLEKKNLEDKIEFKNRELTTNVMTIMKNNTTFDSILKELLELEKKALHKETRQVLKTITTLIHNSKENRLWKEFDIRFKQVHNKFYNNLTFQFPELSPSEQRLCALLKMNMSTKDIADLTGNTPRSIDTARYRVRKKMKLNTNDNLVTFICKL
ncbi:MAG: hypothetical protein ACEPOV_09035 [Hyphomicrobiales bacterium]